MVIVANATDPDNPNPRKGGTQVVRIADVTRTVQQANILLGIAGQAANLLVRSHDVGTTVEIDPVAAKSARETYEMAHTRLRDMIDDELRWSRDDDMKPAFDRLHSMQAKVGEAEALLAGKQKELVEASLRPSVALGANVRQYPLENGGTLWLAFLGQMPHPNSLLGEGQSPAEAMHNFDLAYVRKLAEQLPATEGPTEQPPKRRNRRPRKSKEPNL